MYRFTAEGRRVAKSWCPITGGKHQPHDTMARQDTFFCKRCGAIPRDSIWYDVDEVNDDGPLDHPREAHG